MKNRYIEIDLLRTLAIIGMIIYHTAFDLASFYDWDIDLGSGFWKFLQHTTAITFLLLVGISFSISWDRARRGIMHYAPTRKYLRRGLIVIGFGMLVSIATLIVDSESYVRFGILHLIGVSLLLLPFFARFKEANALLGILVIILGNYIASVRVGTSLLLPLGILPQHFVSVDYFPMLPWFGVILIGMAIGQLIYIRFQKWRHSFSVFQSQFSILLWPSRHALVIYLVHQPIILLILWIFFLHP